MRSATLVLGMTGLEKTYFNRFAVHGYESGVCRCFAAGRNNPLSKCCFDKLVSVASENKLLAGYSRHECCNVLEKISSQLLVTHAQRKRNMLSISRHLIDSP